MKFLVIMWIALCPLLVMASESPPLLAEVSISTAAGFVPDTRLRPDDRTVFMAAKAVLGEGLTLREYGSSHIMGDVGGWTRPSQTLSWTVTAAESDHYAIEIVLKQVSSVPVRVEVSCAGKYLVSDIPPRGSQAWVWQRVPLAGLLEIPKGSHPVTVRALTQSGDFNLVVRSIELVRPAVRRTQTATALSMRADTTWLQQAGFGLMVTWTPDTWPRHGDRQPYEQAVNAFDVPAFVQQVADTGAGFVVFITAHAHMTIPAPCQALDQILSGRTTKRDLIAEIATALEQRHIKLFLYYHMGSASDVEWLKATKFFATDSTTLFANWTAIIEELGRRYGTRVSGWWFDDGMATYSWHQAPWQQLYQSSKVGNPQRLVGLNAYEWPMPTEFMDYNTGETPLDPAGFGWLIKGGTGIYQDGPGKGFQATFTVMADGSDQWLHGQRDTEIRPPRWDSRQLSELLQRSAEFRSVPILNCEIYQDGSLSEKTVTTFREARQK